MARLLPALPTQAVAELLDRWGARSGLTDRGAVDRQLLAAVLGMLAADGGEGAEAVTGPAYALGTLRAQAGHSTTSLVEDVLALRPVIWGHVAGAPGEDADLGRLLMLQDRLSELLDRALRCAVEAYVEESTRVLAHRATRDPLTGLPNRSVFDEALLRETAAARRGDPPAVLILDVDAFKGVNDTCGHLGGDEVLRVVAAALSSALRGADVPARLGGDEFAAVLPRTPAARAVRAADRVLAAVRGDAALRRLAVPVSVSVGVGFRAGEPTADDAATELVALADRALYLAKQAGGDRVELVSR